MLSRLIISATGRKRLQRHAKTNSFSDIAANLSFTLTDTSGETGNIGFAGCRIAKATAEYADLYREHPLDREVKNNYIQLLIQSKRFAEARRLDDEILKTNPNDEDALVYQSQMQISQGDVNTATQTLQTVNKNAPKNSEAH